jgi:hypothetical protein
MKKLLCGTALAVLMGSSAHAITVDGILDPAYGAAKSVVTYDPSAAEGNFGAPTSGSDAIGYSIYLKAQNGYVYGFLQASGPGTPVGDFANLYFDISGANSSNLGFEVGNQDAFIPGGSGPVPVANIVYATTPDNLNFEFAIPNIDFTAPIAGLTYNPGQTFPSVGDTITLRLSQSFGDSVAGGASYGPSRLGQVVLASAAPEPATWAMLLVGVGGVGGALRMARRKQEAAATA